jgi:hypothetical protein
MVIQNNVLKVILRRDILFVYPNHECTQKREIKEKEKADVKFGQFDLLKPLIPPTYMP